MINGDFQAVIADFGKATFVSCAKTYNLSVEERAIYEVYHRHVAPELVNSQCKQSKESDIFSLGYLISSFRSQIKCPKLLEISHKMRSKMPQDRPSLGNILTEYFKS